MAIKKTYKIPLDIKESSYDERHTVVEGDNGNEFEITLTDGGIAIDLTGCKVLAIFSLSNGRTVQQDTDGHGVTVGGADNNVITVDLYTSSFAPGNVNCEIQVMSGTAFETLVTSAKFSFKCRRPIMNADTVQSTDEYPILVGLIDRVEAAEEGLADIEANESARQAAELEREALAGKWENPSATATTLAAGAEATAAAEVQTNGVEFRFGIPRGPQGVSGVYVGPGEMPEGYNVQIDPTGEPDYTDVSDPIAIWNAINSHTASKSNPHEVTAEQIPHTHSMGEVTGLTDALAGKQAAVVQSIPTESALTVADNREYRYQSPLTALTITYPAGNFECWIKFQTGAVFTLTLPSDTAYIGAIPTFEASTWYEMSIKDGVAILGQAGAGA